MIESTTVTYRRPESDALSEWIEVTCSVLGLVGTA